MATAVETSTKRNIPVKSIDTTSQQDVIPSDDMIRASADLPVYDCQGNKHSFQSLHATPGQRHLIIFVRHFYCGMCQDYLRAVSNTMSPAALAEIRPPTTISVIGCGDASLIDAYRKNSSCHQDISIYADPSRKLYEIFNLVSNLAGGEKRPEYQTTGIVSLVSRSIVQGLHAGSGALKGGNISQVGGEFLFQEGKVTWCHRMTHTRDHTAVADLQKVLGI